MTETKLKMCPFLKDTCAGEDCQLWDANNCAIHQIREHLANIEMDVMHMQEAQERVFA